MELIWKFLKVHDPGDVVPYVSSGQADVAVTYMTSLILGAKQRGANFKVIGYLIKEPLNSIIFNASEEIKQPSGLSEQVIGCVTDGNPNTFIAAHSCFESCETCELTYRQF